MCWCGRISELQNSQTFNASGSFNTISGTSDKNIFYFTGLVNKSLVNCFLPNLGVENYAAQFVSYK